MSQPQGSDRWQEPSANGGTPTATGIALIKDGSDWDLGTAAPEGALVDVVGDGNYRIIDLTPNYLVLSGGDYAVSATAPADAILVEDDDGNITLSTDLLDAEAADLLYDAVGDLWLVQRSADRLGTVQIRGNILTY